MTLVKDSKADFIQDDPDRGRTTRIEFCRGGKRVGSSPNTGGSLQPRNREGFSGWEIS